MGVVVKRYIDILIILLIPIPLVLALLHYNDIILLTIAVYSGYILYFTTLVICNCWGGAEGAGNHNLDNHL